MEGTQGLWPNLLASWIVKHLKVKVLLKSIISCTMKWSEVAQCPTLCYSMDCSLPGSSIHRIFCARVLEWGAIFFSRDLPDPGIEPRSPPHCGWMLYHLSHQGSSCTMNVLLKWNSGAVHFILSNIAYKCFFEIKDKHWDISDIQTYSSAYFLFYCLILYILNSKRQCKPIFFSKLILCLTSTSVNFIFYCLILWANI